MRLFSCRACQAKDAEIARLWQALEKLLPQSEEVMPRDVPTGLEFQQPTSGVPVASGASVVDQLVELFLDAKFVHGTPLWRQQWREAEKLAVEGVDAERIMETLARGQRVEF